MRKILVLGALYLCQGLPFGFFTVALPFLLRGMGTSLEAIGWSALLAVPWSLKFLWGPIVDRRGDRRTWILALQGLTVLFLGGLALYDARADATTLCLAVLLSNLLASVQDVATDGFAVDFLGDDDRGLGNGFQVAGYRAGMLLGGGAIVILLGRLGWQACFGTMAAIVALASVPVWLEREPVRGPRAPGQALAGFLGFFTQPGIWGWIGVIALYKLGEALGTAMVGPWLSDLGYTSEAVGWLKGTAGNIAGLVGALLGGALVNRVGRRGALVAFGVLQSLAVLGYVGVAAAHGAGIGPVIIVEHLLSGMATVSLFTAMMDACRPAHAATDYTNQAIVIVLVQGIGTVLAGYVAGPLGYGTAAALGGVLSLLGAVTFLWAKLYRVGADSARGGVARPDR